MAENENIGAIAIDVVGNYAPLEADLQEAVAVATSAGEKIAEGLNAGAAGADALSGAMDAAAAGASSFEEQIAALVASGSTLADALATASQSAQTVAAGVEEVGSAAGVAAQQLSLFDEAIAVPYADAAGQLNLFTTELEPIGGAATAAAAGVDALKDSQAAVGEGAEKAAAGEKELEEAAHGAGSAAHAEGIELGELAHKFAELAGIALTIEALKAFAEACVEVAAEEQRVGEGIAFMRGNIADAGAEIERIHELAQELIQPIEAVGKAAQNFAFLGFSAEETASALAVANDTAKASGRSFDSLANSLANISLTGNAMPRTLKQLGIEINDLAEVMGVSADKVKDAFKGMDESSRLDALMAAMQKTAGASEAMANDTESALTKMGNQWTILKEQVGSAIVPLVSEMLPAVGFALKAVATVAIEVVGGIQAVIHVLAGLVATALDGITGLGKAVLLAISGNTMEAVAVATEAVKKIGEDGKNTWMQFQADAQQTTDRVKKLWEEQATSAKESSEDQSKSWGAAARAAAAAALAAKAAADETKKEQAELEAFAKAVGPLLDKSEQSYGDYLTSLYDGGKKASAILSQLTTDIAKGEAELSKMSGAPAAAMQVIIDKLKEAQATFRDFASQDETAKALDNIQEKWKAYAAKVAEEADKIAEQMAADQRKADTMTEQGALEHQTRLLEIERTTAAELTRVHAQTIFDQLAKDQELNDKEYALQKQALQHELEVLDSATEAQFDYASKREAILLKIQALEDKTTGKAAVEKIQAQTAAWQVLGVESSKALTTQIKEADQALTIMKQMGASQGELLAGEAKDLDLRIKLAEQTGTSATAQILALNNVKLAQQALYDQTHLLGDTYVGVINDILKGWDSLGKSIADNIIDEKNWGQVFLDTGKQVAKMILETLVGSAFKALKDSVIESTGLVNGLTGAFNKLLGAAVGGGGNSTTDLGGWMDTIAGKGAKTASSTAGSSVASGLLGTAGAIGGIVSAISGIIGNFQMSDLYGAMKAVALNTLSTANEVTNRRKDAWDQHNGLLDKLDMVFNRLGDVWEAVNKGAQSIVDQLSGMQAVPVGVGSAGGGAASGGGSQLAPPPNYMGSDTNPSVTPYWMMSNVPTSAAVGNASHFGASPAATQYQQAGAAAGGVNLNGPITIAVNGAGSPMETARALADTLRNFSSKFGPYSQ